VQAGKQYTITSRNVAIADLVPAKGAGRHEAVTAVEQMKAFMAKNPAKGVNIKDLIEEGRAWASCSTIPWSCAGISVTVPRRIWNTHPASMTVWPTPRFWCGGGT
jgi:antitoxin (DNA-binding transcriptional repressor) of toxin-antitoxin stability system